MMDLQFQICTYKYALPPLHLLLSIQKLEATSAITNQISTDNNVNHELLKEV